MRFMFSLYLCFCFRVCFAADGTELSQVEGLLHRYGVNPNDEKLIFEIALAYDKFGNRDEAEKWFLTRLTKEGAKEELWGCMYKLGEIHEAKGEWNQALQWYQKAFQTSPNRAEPLYKIAQHYRYLTEHNVAFLYATMGLQIPTPNGNPLFFNPQLYDFLFDELLSTSAFYTPFAEEGRQASERIILKKGIDGYLRDQTYKNMIYYTPILAETKIQSITPTLPHLQEESKGTYFPMNPSIQKTDQGYRVICRTVNYTRHGYGNFKMLDADGISRTRNLLLEYDQDLRLLSQKEIVEHFPRHWKALWEGLEDCRLFANQKEGIWFSCASIGTHPRNIGQSLCKLSDQPSEETVEVENLIPLKGPDDCRCEKNWLPFIHDGQLLMIYGYDPFTIFKVNQETGEHEVLIKDFLGIDLGRLRGSAAPVEWNGGYLLVTHEPVADSDKITYLHRFLFLNKDLKLTRLSKHFFFRQRGLEYCSGMTIDHSGKNLIMTIGVDDHEAYFVTLAISQVESLLEPICE